ncbi:hypothetical protein F383_00439 [Gossypium arboreum]|uniref:Uncharacterized protein n=1 Tax=Gossypium arboreum TaxID=29729 RepID=A0A0B0PA25_GOSAR|nr:hypothetical protein F383_00439 [Gossypium arboreum]
MLHVRVRLLQPVVKAVEQSRACSIPV